jgi:hypothetical protein
MEEKLRKKALAILILLILLFSLYCVYLATVVPDRRAVLYTDIDYFDSVLDSWNVSDLRNIYNQPSFLQYYNVNVNSSVPHWLAIISPKNNSNIVIYLSNYEGDIYFHADGYMMVGALGTTDSWPNLEEDIRAELVIVLTYIGHPELANNLIWDDNDFATMLSFFHFFAFFGFAALIIMLVFMRVFRQGWLLTNLKLIDRNVPLFFGVVSLYFSIGFGLICAWMTIADAGMNIWLICWAVPATFLIVGIYLIVAETNALAQ